MKTLLIILFTILLSGCKTTITIKPDGEILVEGPRTATIITDKVAISTGKMLMDDATIVALTKEATK